MFIMSRHTILRRRMKGLSRNIRGVREVVRALISTEHPLLAHIIPIRRCNLACEYCNEYDDFSKPVPTESMFQRVDKLGELGTSVVTISGGEPLLHPELDEIIRRIRKNGIIAGLITNGYLLTAERIEKLNRAGLEWLQISIDNVTPDEVSKKSLKVLDKKLQLLAEYADFHVNINSVVGGGVRSPQDALTIGKRALELGFSSTVGIIHDGGGQLQPLGEEERRVYHEMKAMEKRSFTRVNSFQDNIAQGRPNQWRCRVGILGSRWRTTPSPTFAGNTSPRNHARRTARCLAYTRYRFSIRGAPRNFPRLKPLLNRAAWCTSSSFIRRIWC